MKKICFKHEKLYYRQRDKNNNWQFDSKNLFCKKKCLYVFNDEITRKKLISKNYNNLLTKYFDINKILKLIQKNIIDSFTKNKIKIMLKFVIFDNVSKSLVINRMRN